MLKGLILVAGEGSRLRPLTFSTPKPLLPLLGKPLVQYVIDELKKVEIREIGLVIGHLGYLFKQILKDGSQLGVKLSYIEQRQRLGIAHAIHRSIEAGFLDEEFVVYLGDNLLSNGIVSYVKKFRELGSDVHILLARVKDPTRFGVASIKNGKVVKLVEKPKEPPSDLALVGVYMFRDPDTVQKAFSHLKPSWRGEYEITDLIQWFINNGYHVSYDIVEGWWKDIGTRDSILEGMRLILDKITTAYVEGEVVGYIEGRVLVEKGAIVEGRVYGPAYIGRNVTVSKETIIESYTSLESNTQVRSGKISRSLILNDASINLNKARLVDSVVGRYSQINVTREIYGDIKVFISDYSKIDI